MVRHDRFNLDLPKHAVEKVRRALDDVLQLTDDPGEKLRIALMACSVPIGTASGILAALAKAGGNPEEECKAAQLEVLEILRLNAVGGPDAVFDRFDREMKA